MEFENLRKKRPSIFSRKFPRWKVERASDRWEWRSVCLRDSRRSKHRLHATLRSSSTQTRSQRCANRKRSVATSAPGYLWTTAFIISCVTFSKWKQQWKVRSRRRFLRMCTVVRRRRLCNLKLIVQLAGKWICWGICDICDICITFSPPWICIIRWNHY